MRQLQETIIPTMSGASGATSDPIDSQNLFAISVIGISGATEVGVLKLQASNDNPVASNAVPTNWADIPSATVNITAGAVLLIPKTDLCYQYIRAVYTHSSGTGTITVIIKALGA